MDDDDNPNPSGSRQQLSFTLEHAIPSVSKSQSSLHYGKATTAEAKRMDEIAQQLSKHGCTFVESSVTELKNCPDYLKNDAQFLFDKITVGMGKLNVLCDSNFGSLPRITGLTDFNIIHLKAILAGEGTFEEYINKLKQYHSAPRCNVVWRQNTVAYRCHTCGKNSCMSLCAQCFEEADHEGHDYSRFFSTVGGCCDCGNPDVMDPEGFCKRHCEGASRKSVTIPPHSLALLKFIMARLISRTLVCLRRWCLIKHNIGGYFASTDPGRLTIVATNDTLNRGIVPIINFIVELSEAGSAVTDILIDFFLDKNFYNLICRVDCDPRTFTADEAPDWRLSPNLKNDMQSLANLKAIRTLVTDKETLYPIHIECILDELVLYLIRIGYPQELIDMLLNLLYDTRYKQHFAKKFFSYYPYTTAMVAELLNELPIGSREGSRIAERIVHISVQICSGSNICAWLQNEINIIQCVLRSAVMMSLSSSRPTQISHAPERFYAMTSPDMLTRYDTDWLVANVEENQYFERSADLFVLTDTQNLLVHEPIAKAFFADESLISLYIRHTELFQGFTVEWRISFGDHRTHDWVSVAQKSYNVEFEACSLAMHNLIQHVSTVSDCEKFFLLIHNSLTRWFSAIHLDSVPTTTITPPYLITFHLPLHRNLATLIFQMQSLGGECKTIIDFLIGDEAFLRKLILHPIRIHVARSQYYASMWTRNGQGMRVAVSHYCKPTITFSFQSADLILLRFAAANINQEFFWTCIMNGFSLPDCFNYPEEMDEINVGSDSRNLVTRKVWISFLIDGALRLVCDLLIGRRDTEPDSDELLKIEIITLLARQDLPYSHVKAVMPSRGQICYDKQMEVFDRLLHEVANFVEPDQDNSLQHGRFELKDEYYDTEVDPLFCRLRSFGNLDYTEFTTRSEQHEKAKAPQLPNTVSPWFGYRMYNFDEYYSKRFDSLKGVAALLSQPSFFIIMNNVLKMVISPHGLVHLICYQNAIYLLTMSVQFIKSKLFDKCKLQLFHPNEFMEPAIFTDAHHYSIRESIDPRKAVIRYFLKDFGTGKDIISMVIELFCLAVKAQHPGCQERFIYLTLQKAIEPVGEEKLQRIYGSAQDYVGRLLNVLVTLDSDIESIIVSFIQGGLAENPEPMEVDTTLTTASSSSSTETPVNDRKAMLKAKKEAYFKSLQARSAKLMKHHMQTEGITQDEMDRIDTKTVQEATYLCPICSETTNHSLANPIGLFVHTRPNAIIPNCIGADEMITDVMQLEPSGTRVPTKENPVIKPRRIMFDQRDKLCYEVYPKQGAAALKSLRFRTGIEVRTCQHFAHLSCYKSYVNSIVNNASPIFRPEFTVSCPMCRTPINAILPLKMEYGREKIRADFDILDIKSLPAIKHLYNQRLRDPRPVFNDEILKKQTTEYRQAYEEFEDIAYRQLRSCYETRGQMDLMEKRFKGYSARLGYVQSNVDKLVMFGSIDLPLPALSKGSVIEHILSGAVTLSLGLEIEQIKVHAEQIFDSTTGRDYTGDNELPPLLICDFQSLYLRCASLPLVDERFVDEDRRAYCLLIYRTLLILCLTRGIQNTISKCTSEAAINEFINKAQFGKDTVITRGLQKVMDVSRDLFVDLKERLFNPLRNPSEPKNDFTSLNDMVEFTKLQTNYILTYFAKFVFMVDREIFKKDITTEEKAIFASNNFESLYGILFDRNDGSEDMAVMAQSSRYFLTQFGKAMELQESQKLTEILITETFNWKYRTLLNLPKLYDKLFTAFFGHKCESCKRPPKHQMLCLLCGSLMCLNKCNMYDDSHSDTNTYIELHTASCGSGCCCYLSLNSTMIVINYYRLTAIWGTVYMDAHGEEDRNLIRGKPLYLSEHRMKQLQRSWLTQDLDNRANLRWFTLDQLALALRQSHHNFN